MKNLFSTLALLFFALLALADDKEKSAESTLYQYDASTQRWLALPKADEAKRLVETGTDPILIRMALDKDSVALGETLRISIVVSTFDTYTANLVVSDEWRSYSLKMLLPDGFVQTGGTYSELIEGRLHDPNESHIYTLEGHFTQIYPLPFFQGRQPLLRAGEGSNFKLLRGFAGQPTGLFILKSTATAHLKNNPEPQPKKITLAPSILKTENLGNPQTPFAALQQTNDTPQNAIKICTDNIQYPSTGNSTNQGTYACLNEVYSPSWYTFKIGNTGGKLRFTIKGEKDTDDIDFACWGPFDTEIAAKAFSDFSNLSSSKLQDCSFEELTFRGL